MLIRDDALALLRNLHVEPLQERLDVKRTRRVSRDRGAHVGPQARSLTAGLQQFLFCGNLICSPIIDCHHLEPKTRCYLTLDFLGFSLRLLWRMAFGEDASWSSITASWALVCARAFPFPFVLVFDIGEGLPSDVGGDGEGVRGVPNRK